MLVVITKCGFEIISKAYLDRVSASDGHLHQIQQLCKLFGRSEGPDAHVADLGAGRRTSALARPFTVKLCHITSCQFLGFAL